MNAKDFDKMSDQTPRKIAVILKNNQRNNKKLTPEEYKIVSQIALDYIKLEPKGAAQDEKLYVDVGIDYVAQLTKVLEESKLIENPAFIAFITDIAVNTGDFSPQAIKEISLQSNGKISTSLHTGSVQLPVLDRFMKLLMTLSSPSEATKDRKI